jgi:hypothetical protein
MDNRQGKDKEDFNNNDDWDIEESVHHTNLGLSTFTNCTLAQSSLSGMKAINHAKKRTTNLPTIADQY